jgi:hypothetical protein
MFSDVVFHSQRFVAEMIQIQLFCLLTVMLLCDGANGQTWLQRHSNIDGEEIDDNSGYSVALSSDGRTLAVGAWLNGGNGTSSGHVRVFRDTGTAWLQLGDDIDGEAAGDESVMLLISTRELSRRKCKCCFRFAHSLR